MEKIIQILRVPYIWGSLALLNGLVFAVQSISVWIVAALMLLFIAFLKIQGEAEHHTEGKIFAGGPLIMIGWIIGFSIRGIIF
ncbi:MAG: hypothetical protein CL699_06390 [Chloroflexi bacterium]|nr:MAG: hypothetical protein EGP10_02295 [SAR202 cluster bacterium]MAO75909.1 hypothetical protein [Chloroflexota bacterium]|tara:strand:- start:1221 stop:1469 length:249 start_codon:yes stop_codon:yes gene_type:complete